MWSFLEDSITKGPTLPTVRFRRRLVSDEGHAPTPPPTSSVSYMAAQPLIGWSEITFGGFV